MEALRAIARVGVLWVLSLAAALAVMEAGHRFVVATDRDTTVPVPMIATSGDLCGP
jgi:HD-like signal output (HDOD) protein